MRSLAIVTLVMSFTLPCLAFDADDVSAAKELILDGSMVHDVGRLHLNVTNFGLPDSKPGAGSRVDGRVLGEDMILDLRS